MVIKTSSAILKIGLFCLAFGLLLVPGKAKASGDGTDNGIGNGGVNNGQGDGEDNGKGNGGENNGHNDDGGGGSVPVNGGLVFLTVAGVAYCAKKFYSLQKKQLAVA